MKFLFLFMDGIGLGANDAEENPFAQAHMPNLNALLNDAPMVADTVPVENGRATLLALDASMGVDGVPQSATGQAALLTGRNVPEQVGEHYGPKPNKPVAACIREGTLFHEFMAQGKSAALLNAYPQPYFDGINSGKRLFSAIPLAVTDAGYSLKTKEDLFSGQALSADFTGQGWQKFFEDEDVPVMSEDVAGKKLAELTQALDFAFFEYWPSDYAGHRQDKSGALALLESFDKVLGGLLGAWDEEEGLILITSDHGNMEDLSTRRHTLNPVPALVIGAPELRTQFTQDLAALHDIAPAILDLYR